MQTMTPMQREKIFSKGGAYEFVIEYNILLHNEAIEMASKVISNHLTERLLKKEPICVLDLACGGRPIVFSGLAQKFPDSQFEYNGVDVNPDQVERCRNFKFSQNVRLGKIVEGNSWDLEALPFQKTYDIILMGLNTHHGIPEEILYLAKQMYRQLNAPGLFINHDVFRPDRYSYIRRPDSVRFISKEKIQPMEVVREERQDAPPDFSERGFTPRERIDWREDWLKLHTELLKKHGASQEILNDAVTHVMEWDYPVSLKEMGTLLKQAGFNVALHDYLKINHPLPDFYGMAVGIKK